MSGLIELLTTLLKTPFFLPRAGIERLHRRGSAPIDDKSLAASLSVACTVLILSHEPLVAYLPYCAAALWICLRSVKRVATILAVPALLAATATLLAVTHIGNATVVRDICASLGTPNLSTCSAAVQALADSKEEAARNVVLFTHRFHYYRNYAISLALGLIPVIAGGRELTRSPAARRSLLAVLGAVCVSLPLTISLFRYGVDWGRWIYIHMMSVFLLLLLIDTRRKIDGPRSDSGHSRSTPHALATAALCVIYATCWSMPGVKDKPRFGWVSLTERVVHWNGSLSN